MFLYDPDRQRLGEFTSACVIDGELLVNLRGLKPLRIPYEYDYAALELRRLACAVREGDVMYALDCDHRLDLSSVSE